MKKIVLLLVVLSLVAGQALFAQDDGLKITGHVKTGVEIKANNLDKLLFDDSDLDQQLANTTAYGSTNPIHNGQVREYSADAKTNTELRLNFDYVKENVFAHARFNVYEGGIDPAFAYGGFSFLDKKVEVSAGRLDNRKWGSFNDFHLDAALDNHNLVKIDIQPIEGLTFGVNIFSVRWDSDQKQEFKDAFKSTVYGGGYEIKDTFGIHIGFVGYNDNDGTSPYKDFGPWKVGTRIKPPSYFTSRFEMPKEWAFGSLLSTYFYGVDNLKLDLEAYLGTSKYGADMSGFALGIGVQGMYTIESLKIGAKVDFDTLSGKDTTVDEGASFWQLGITPKAEYELNEWLILGIDIPIGIIDNVVGKGTNVKEFIDTTIAWKGGFSIGAKPKATFKLGNGCKFITFYELGVLRPGYASKDFGTGNDLKAPSAKLEHTIQFDFIWEF